jgi:hypothetical protein
MLDQPIVGEVKYRGSYPEVQVSLKGKIAGSAIRGGVLESALDTTGGISWFDSVGRADYRSKFGRKRNAG